jgi:hypothetical protein
MTKKNNGKNINEVRIKFVGAAGHEVLLIDSDPRASITRVLLFPLVEVTMKKSLSGVALLLLFYAPTQIVRDAILATDRASGESQS